MMPPFRGRGVSHCKCSVSLFVLLLTGCAVPLDLASPLLVVPEAALLSQSAVIASHSTLDNAALPAQWWSLFGDSLLDQLETEAAGSNLDLQVAAARIEEGRAQLGLVDAARKPQITAEADYSRGAISKNSPLANLGAYTGGSNTWSMGMQAGWELDLWGYHRHLSESASAELEAMGHNLQTMSVTVTAEVARVYLLLRGVQAQETITRQNQQIAQGLVDMTESRELNGVATRFDAASARADLATINAGLSQLGHQRSILMNALSLLLGQPPRELNARLVEAELPSMPARLSIGVPSELARNRPDILQAEARLRAAVADIGAAKADFYPRIGLSGSLGLQSIDLSDLGSWDSRHYSLGPTLYLPVFVGGRLESQLALTEARQRIAAINYQQTVLRAWHEVDDALDAYSNEQERHGQLQLALQQNQVALEVAQRAYQQGTVDFTSVLVARRSLLASQSELNDCATAAALSVVALYRALGGGWSEQLQLAAHPTERPS
ncbi:efflux transporter outer membrane subunit [Pseudomonas brenneri]|uniref:efflux transporter outer membrane subunit n=1 Tax=Pseudomonas brenneri TaxID=129817 RepID=UPI003570D8CE